MLERAVTYKGWVLVQVGQYYFSACKGSRRAGVGSMRHGDRSELMRKVRAKGDELEREEDECRGDVPEASGDAVN